MQHYLVTIAVVSAAAGGSVDAAIPAADVPIRDAAAFEEIDQDRDGRLDPDEARQSEELTTYFVVWDTDQNGQLDVDEIRAGREDVNTTSATNNDARDAGKVDYGANFTVIDFETPGALSRLDVDDDGYVEPSEWAESGEAVPFSDVDQDNDGLLDETELAATEQLLRAAPRSGVDATGNGSERENFDTWEDWEEGEDPGPGTSRRIQMMSDDMSSGIHFTALDTDGNGMLDRLEATDNNYVLAHFEEWDVDNNELLDPDEVDEARMELDMR